MIKTIKIFKKGTLIVLGTLFLNSCGTVTPNPIEDSKPRYDSSTPKQYNANNSGFIGYLENDSKTIGGIITKNSRELYNNLIISYAGQFYESEKIRIHLNDGVDPYKDIYGNDLFIIDAEHLAFFMKLNRWKKENKPSDSIWMKAKTTILN